ncbi:MAG: hypothetical protein ACI865_001861 [Flavobacteriaceae bacterium]|jgi:hypothetical protein
MKKGLTIFYTIALGAIITGCSSSVSTDSIFEDLKEQIEKVEYNNVEIANLYAMDLPDFMTVATELNDQASLQYSNPYKEKYIIVINESKDEFVEIFKSLDMYDDEKSIVDNFAEQQYNFMKEESNIVSETEMRSLKTNGMKVRSIDFDANVAGIPETVSYFYGFVEGEENLYTIMAWTAKGKKDSYKEEVEKMIKSINEL